MSPEEKNLDLIDRYLRKELSDQERREVEDRLLNDQQFKAQVKWQEDLQDVIREKSNKSLKQFLQDHEDQQQAQSVVDFQEKEMSRVKKVSYNWTRWVAAALFIGFLSWFVFQQFQSNTTDLFAAHFNKYPNEIVLIERSNDSPDALQQAFIAYQQNDLKDAILQFDQIIASNSNDSLLFYKAIAHLSISEIDIALPILETLNQKSSWRFSEAVRWYLALAYLKKEDTNRAKPLLESIANAPDGYFQKTAAQSILRQI